MSELGELLVVKRFLLSVATAVAVLCTSGCLGTDLVIPFPASPSAQPVPTTSATATLLLDGLGIDPCQLLSSAEATTLSVPITGRRTDVAATRSCVWTAFTKIHIVVAVDGSHGVDLLDDLGGTAIPLTIGRHHGRRVIAEGSDGCDIHLALTPTTSATVGVSGGADTALACDVALHASTLVEAKLP